MRAEEGSLQQLSFLAVPGLPLVQPDDDLAKLVGDALLAGPGLESGDVLIVAQKIVSKAENRYVFLDQVQPSAEALALAREVDKDPRLVQLILDESSALVRKARGLLIVRHRLGFVHANAGIDQSNIEHEDGRERALLLPRNPDASAARLREALQRRFDLPLAVIINDSMGRPFRLGTLGLAIGVAGLRALEDYMGEHDLFGRELLVTQVAAADELAAGASLVMGQTSESIPLVVARGYPLREPVEAADCGVVPLLRPADRDLFR